MNILLATLFLLAAVYTDCRTLKIPNWLNLLGAFSALLCWGILQSGWIFALKNLLLGLAVGFLFYMLNLIGAGDAKALAVISGFAGLPTAVLTYALGSTFLLVWVTPARVRKLGVKTLLKCEAYALMCYISRCPEGIENLPDNRKLPFAPFLFLGFLTAVIVNGVI